MADGLKIVVCNFRSSVRPLLVPKNYNFQEMFWNAGGFGYVIFLIKSVVIHKLVLVSCAHFGVLFWHVHYLEYHLKPNGTY